MEEPITSLNGGRIPTYTEGVWLINKAGGTILRAEGVHLPPNPHTCDHIKYLINGIKGTLRIILGR